MYMPFDIAQLFLIFAGVIGGWQGRRQGRQQGRQQGRRQGQLAGSAGRVSWQGQPAGSAGRVSQRGQSAGGAQKASASAAVSKLSTAAVVVAPLMASRRARNSPRKRSRSVF